MSEDVEGQGIESEEDDPLLALLMADEEDVEDFDEPDEHTARREDKNAKKLKALSEIVERNERQKQADKIYSQFMAEASDTAKEIYAVLADDDMTPAQMTKVTAAAKRKAAAIDEKASPEKVEEVVEQRVNDELANRWGLSPVSTDKTRAESASDHQKELMDRIARGDVAAYIESTFLPPPGV